MTQNGAFGIDSEIHNIRLCSNKSPNNPRTFRLHEHFRRLHHLTPLASLALTRAIMAGQDPLTTRLFNPHHIILNIEELRTVPCPLQRPFVNYPDIDLIHCPCYEMKPDETFTRSSSTCTQNLLIEPRVF